MELSHTSQLVLIIVLGAFGQWLAWLIRLPSILVLLVFGLMAGPGFNLIHPDKLFGELLYPLVSIAVAIILFEGGMTLSLKDFRQVGQVVKRFCTVGVIVAWASITTLSFYVLDFGFELSLLTGALLVVTGPTVIIPLLRDINPSKDLASALKWEGILTDSVGAVLAVLVLEWITQGGQISAFSASLGAFGAIKALLVGILIGACGATLGVMMIRFPWAPDYLENVLLLAIILVCFYLSNIIQYDAGLVTVTLMGLMLANQSSASTKHIAEFKEVLQILIISTLFIVLAARVDLSQLLTVGAKELLFLGGLILVCRPLTVLLSTWGTGLTLKEKTLLSFIAPRGIVALAVATIITDSLAAIKHPGAVQFSNAIFVTVLGTVVVYSLVAPLLTTLLGLKEERRGIIILGAHNWACGIAKALTDEGARVLMVDTNLVNSRRARRMQLDCHIGNVLGRDFKDIVESGGYAQFLALSSNDEINALAALSLSDSIPRSNISRLIPTDEKDQIVEGADRNIRAAYFPETPLTFNEISQRFAKGDKISVISPNLLTPAIASGQIPLFAVQPTGQVVPFTRPPSATRNFSAQTKIIILGPADGIPKRSSA